MNQIHIHCIALAFLATLATASAAVPIAIMNGGFEDPVLTDGGTDFAGAFTGWTAFNGSGAQIGILNPATSDLTGEAPEGDNVGLVSQTTGDGGLSQVLTSTLQADATYSLSVQVANTKFTGDFPGYRVQLLAAGTVLAEDDDSQVVAEDTAVGVTVPYTYTTADAALLGEALEIRLLGKAINTDEVAFDDVQLTVTLANPAANAGGDYKVPTGNSLSLDGSASQPSDGETITTYEWDLNNDGTFGDITGITPAAIPDAELIGTWGMTVGANTIQLRVTDSSLKTSTAQATVVLRTSTLIDTAGGNDNWNTATNWDSNTVPSGAEAAIVSAGLDARASGTPPTYSGGLTLEENASLTLMTNSSVSALGTGTITMAAGSRIVPRTSSNSFPAFVLTGNATVWGGISTSGHHTTRTFASPIAGPGQLTLDGVNNNTMLLDAANTCSALVLQSSQNQGFRVEANITGALGTGDVTVNANATLQVDAPDAMDSSKNLFVNGRKDSRKNAKLILNQDITVNEFHIDGFQAAAGSYDSSSGLVETNGDAMISGSGTLTVTTGPVDTTAPMLVSIGDNVNGGPIFADVPTVTFTVSFDEDIDASTVSAADFDNAGTATFTIGTITKTSGPVVPSIFTVEVNPTSTGTLQLRIPSGATIDDVSGNTLAGLPRLDDTTIAINAGTSPPTTITGTGGGNDSWNEAGNWDITIPFGPYPAVVGAGVTAKIETAPSIYTASLTLEAGATLQVRNRNALGVLESPSKLILNTGATIDVLDGSPDFGPVELAGDARFTWRGNGAHHETIDFDGVISGSGELFINGVNNDTFNLNTANTFSGGLRAESDANQGFRINAKVDGALGTGDVTINNKGTLKIAAGLANAIDDGATLSLSGEKDNKSPGTVYKIDLLSDETVNEFWLDGAQLAAGDYDNSSGLLTPDGNPVISGTGTLTVLSGATTTPPFDTWATGPFSGTLDNTNASLDFDKGGLQTGIEWVVGGDPTDGSDDAGLAPSIDTTTSPGNALFVFRRSADAEADTNTTITVEYGSTLQGWTEAVDGTDDVSIAVEEDGFGSGIDKVTVTLPAALAVDGALYARLNVVVTAP